MSDILTEILKRRDDTIADLEAKVAASSLTIEQQVRLSLSVACVRSADNLNDIALKDFIESVSTYVLTGDKQRQ